MGLNVGGFIVSVGTMGYYLQMLVSYISIITKVEGYCV
jgi:hypothetical protein